MHLWDSNNLQEHIAIPINNHVPGIPLTGTMTQKYAQIIPLYVMCIGIAFKFCQTYGTMHQWISQIPWQYLGKEIYATTFISQNIGGVKVIVSLSVQKLGRTSPPIMLKLGPCIAEYVPSFSCWWTPKGMWTQRSYYRIHEARIQDCGSTCSRGSPKTSNNFSEDVVWKYPQSLVVERSIVAM